MRKTSKIRSFSDDLMSNGEESVQASAALSAKWNGDNKRAISLSTCEDS